MGKLQLTKRGSGSQHNSRGLVTASRACFSNTKKEVLPVPVRHCRCIGVDRSGRYFSQRTLPYFTSGGRVTFTAAPSPGMSRDAYLT